MDEIIIEEKKYISSKQAAKITGYAKDYIGQLCREGRVSARLVGRNWYVLETAIQDHRFGDPEPEIAQEKTIKTTSQTTEKASQTAIAQGIQESWQAWFDRFDHTESVIKTEDATEPQPELESKQEEPEPAEPEHIQEEASAVDIPIHVHTEPAYTIPAELLPHHFDIKSDNEEHYEEEPILIKSTNKRIQTGMMMNTLKICGILLALVIFAIAVIGSGYFDRYALSNNQIRILAGVSFYNK
jgi:hypothetical protein